jgi:hypothetical protein
MTLAVIGLVTLLFVAAGVPILVLIELKTYDLQFRSRGPRQPSVRAIHVDRQGRLFHHLSRSTSSVAGSSVN